MTANPLVTVIIPTFNWSSVLRYAIQSVRWQTFEDWELWVIGDGCTDDSEAVVTSFGDPQIHWHNLPENTGSQAMPNNKGIELSTGEYIAYLGHDDLWHPSHLQVLVESLKANDADLGYTVTKLIQPLSDLKVALCGLSASGQYEPVMIVPPSSVMHRRSIIDELGPWRTYTSSVVPIDLELILRAFSRQKRIVSVPHLTVFKFPTATRPNAYRDKKFDEQQKYAQRLTQEPEFRYHELMDVVTNPTHIANTFTLKRNVEFTDDYVKALNQARSYRGLELLAITPETISFRDDISSLMAANLKDDIAPLRDRQYLHEHGELPENGLLLGANWYARERDEWGRAFRWVNTDAGILVTKPTNDNQHIVIHTAPGPGNAYQPLTLSLVDEADRVVDQAYVDGETYAEFALRTRYAETTIFRLKSDAAGSQQADRDRRIMNFAVYGFWWKNPEPDALREENEWLRSVRQTHEATIERLLARWK
jgi:glycosyltransferase involved in cell wall biosynthesis